MPISVKSRHPSPVLIKFYTIDKLVRFAGLIEDRLRVDVDIDESDLSLVVECDDVNEVAFSSPVAGIDVLPDPEHSEADTVLYVENDRGRVAIPGDYYKSYSRLNPTTYGGSAADIRDEDLEIDEPSKNRDAPTSPERPRLRAQSPLKYVTLDREGNPKKGFEPTMPEYGEDWGIQSEDDDDVDEGDLEDDESEEEEEELTERHKKTRAVGEQPKVRRDQYTDEDIDDLVAETLNKLGWNKKSKIWKEIHWKWERRAGGKGQPTAIGHAQYRNYQIVLSASLWPYLTPEGERSTIIHEVCHLSTFEKHSKVFGNDYRRFVKPHGREWKHEMSICGYSNAQATASKEDMVTQYFIDKQIGIMRKPRPHMTSAIRRIANSASIWLPGAPVFEVEPDDYDESDREENPGCCGDHDDYA